MRISLHKFFSLLYGAGFDKPHHQSVSSAYNGSSAKFKLKILPYLKHILNVQLCGQYLSIISFSSHLTSSGDVVTIQQAAIRNYSIMLINTLTGGPV